MGNTGGSVFKRSDGRWCGKAIIHGKSRYVYAKTEREAQRKLRELLSNADKGIVPAPQRLTVADFMTCWLDNTILPSTLRDSTKSSYEQLSRLYIIPGLGQVKLSQLRREHLRVFYREMAQGAYSIRKPPGPHTIRRTHAVLHTALEQAVDDNLIYQNPCHNFGHGNKTSLPAVKRTAKALTRKQVESLLETARDTRWYALIVMAVYTGLREGELLGLRWRDVDLATGRLTVSQQISLKTKAFGEPKSEAGQRSFLMPKLCVEALQRHRAMQNEERLIAERWNDIGLVFCTVRPGGTAKRKGSEVHTTIPGSPLTASSVRRMFGKMLQQAGLPPIRWYDLRHTACTLMALQGVRPDVAAKRMGHTDMRLTLQVYTHVHDEHDAEAAAALDRLG